MNSLATLQKEVYPVCLLHNIGFRMLVEEPKFELSDAHRASGDLVLDRQYKIRFLRHYECSSQNIPAFSDMKGVSKHFSETLQPVAH